jgi:hypothetical protein
MQGFNRRWTDAMSATMAQSLTFYQFPSCKAMKIFPKGLKQLKICYLLPPLSRIFQGVAAAIHGFKLA